MTGLSLSWLPTPVGGLAEPSSHERQIAQLEAALASRDLIGQAKGVLMARHRCGADQAFALLRERSQRENVPLRLIAQHVLDDLAHDRDPGLAAGFTPRPQRTGRST